MNESAADQAPKIIDAEKYTAQSQSMYRSNLSLDKFLHDLELVEYRDDARIVLEHFRAIIDDFKKTTLPPAKSGHQSGSKPRDPIVMGQTRNARP